MAQVQSLCTIIDHLYKTLHNNKAQNDHYKKLKEEGKEDDIKLIYEAFFVFALMWSYGASLSGDKLQFSNSVKNQAKP